jgi:hypothetical protein
MLAGPLVDGFGLQVAFLVLAVPVVVIGMICPWLPVLRELDRGGGETGAPPAHS